MMQAVGGKYGALLDSAILARTHGRVAVLAVAGRYFPTLPGGLADPTAPPVGPALWGDPVLRAGRGLPGGVSRDVLTGRCHTPRQEAGRLLSALGAVLAHLPVTLLERTE